MAMINLVSPWIDYYQKIEAMFREDTDVHVLYDEKKNKVIISVVDSSSKASAIATLLPKTKQFGAVTLQIAVVYAHKEEEMKRINTYTPAGLFRDAFDGNDALVYTQVITEVFDNPITYVVFAKKVVQYYTDNLGDIGGLRSTLYQDIARELFGENSRCFGVYYCTDSGNMDFAGGVWP